MHGSSVVDRELLDTSVLCGHLVPAGSVYALLAGHRTRLFPDELFANLFTVGRGRPSVRADVIATAFVLKEPGGPLGSAGCNGVGGARLGTRRHFENDNSIWPHGDG